MFRDYDEVWVKQAQGSFDVYESRYGRDILVVNEDHDVDSGCVFFLAVDYGAGSSSTSVQDKSVCDVPILASILSIVLLDRFELYSFRSFILDTGCAHNALVLRVCVCLHRHRQVIAGSN